MNPSKIIYSFRDLECRYCAEYKTCPPDCLCPYILDNLDDLRTDRKFTEAVQAAETCQTPQKLTLLYIRDERLCV